MPALRYSARRLQQVSVLIGLLVCVFPALPRAQTVRFAIIGDYGCDLPSEAAVAALVKTWNPDFIITAGDNSYGANLIDDNIGKYYHEFIGNYTGAYPPGASANRFFPSLGNHDYSDGAGVNAYLDYFTLPGNERYFDITHGPVQLLAVNSNYQEPDSITSTGPQAQWLQALLASSPVRWQLVYFHHAAYSSSSNHGSTAYMQWPFETWGADVVIGGHDHTYERIVRDDDTDGATIPYFVNGTGGRSLYGFSVPVPGSKVRYNGNYGAQLVTATPYLITFDFYSVAGGPAGTLIDSYSLCDCHGITGNLNGDPDDQVDIEDLDALAQYLFNRRPLWNCRVENDVDQSGGIDISDLTLLIGYLFFGQTLPGCPAPSVQVPN